MRPASTGAGRPYSDGVDALDERRRATIPNDPKFSGWLVWAVAGCWFMDGWTRCVWDRETGFVSTADLEAALRRAEAAHREHEKRTGASHLLHSHQDEDWSAWYASYMVAEQAGTDLPS